MVSAVKSSGFDYSSAGVATTQMKEAASQVKDQVLTQEDFLKLLTTQLQAQDPTNPADNSEIVSQMSQLSMVESLNSINSNMSDVIDTVNSSSNISATNLIGTYVYTDDKYGVYDGSGNVAWSLDAGDEVYTNVKITIKDAQTGEVVYTDTADALTGEVKYAWPGIYAPNGLQDEGTGTGDGGESGEVGEGGDTSDGEKIISPLNNFAKTGESGEGGEVDGGEDGGADVEGGTGEGDQDTGDDAPKYDYCASGRYVIEVTGTNNSGQSVALPTKALALVTSVTLGKTREDTMLTLYGHGEMSFADATKVTL